MDIIILDSLPTTHDTAFYPLYLYRCIFISLESFCLLSAFILFYVRACVCVRVSSAYGCVLMFNKG